MAAILASEAKQVSKTLILKRDFLSGNMFNSLREANWLRLNAKHIEVLKPYILPLIATI